MGSDSEDSDVELSAYAQAALAEFLAEQQVAENDEKEALATVESSEKVIELKEDWQLSQFWYDENTCEKFGQIIKAELKRRNLLDNGKVVFISSPTAFKYMMAKKVLPAEQMHLLEFDKRFGAYSNFSFWDFNHPLELNNTLKEQFDLVLMDPPFLNAGRFWAFNFWKVKQC